MHELPEISTSLTYLLIEEIYWFWVGIKLSLFGVIFSPIDLHWMFKKSDWKPNSYGAQIVGDFKELYLLTYLYRKYIIFGYFIIMKPFWFLYCARSKYQ